MSFDLDNWDKLSAEGNPTVPKIFSYSSSSDAVATIVANNYFDDVAMHLTIGDLIVITGSDGNEMVRVTAVSPHVTVAADPSPAPGSITNTEIASNAAIAFSKLATLTSGHLLVGSAGNVPTSVAMSGDATIIASGALTLGAVVNGAKLATSAPADTAAAVPIMYIFTTVGGATASVSIAVAQKITVTDAWVVNKAAGTASDTITIKNNAGTAITDAMDISGGDKTIKRAGTIDDAQRVVAAGGNLTVTETDGGGSDSPACDVYVVGYKTA